MESMRRILLNVQAFQKEFARKQMECYSEDKKKELTQKRCELNKAKKCITEIDSLIQKIYEDNANGKLSDERYATLSMSYEEEQQRLKADIPEIESYRKTETDKTDSLQKFIDKVKKITELKELTPELIHEFIDRIIVYAPRYLDGKRVQLMDIYLQRCRDPTGTQPRRNGKSVPRAFRRTGTHQSKNGIATCYTA